MKWITTCGNIDETQEYKVEWKKSDIKWDNFQKLNEIKA